MLRLPCQRVGDHRRWWRNSAGRRGRRFALAAFSRGGHSHTVVTFGAGHGEAATGRRGRRPLRGGRILSFRRNKVNEKSH